jgi:predicted phage terminase large subunit-like protein
MKKIIDEDILEAKAKLLGSLLYFTQVAFKMRTGKDFEISNSSARESHYITISKFLTRVFKGEINRGIIRMPPRYGKTEMVIHFIAWVMAHYPDSNFIYNSYASTLAKEQTQTIREIISASWYRNLFDVRISADSSAKDNFKTTAGGHVFAVGVDGAVTGRGAGIDNIDRCGGAIIIDDIHKPKEVLSDAVRTNTVKWFSNTLMSRVNSRNTPIIVIGQALHEDDLPQNLIEVGGWELLELKALDEAGQPLCPRKHTAKELLEIKRLAPYDFASQYQQSPQPAGGGIFKEEWFQVCDKIPAMLTTFLTIDTAETDKSYNDATVFSFWGLHKIKVFGIDSEQLGLFWIDCAETRIEPKDLESELEQFYRECMLFKPAPSFVAIEKKSTGVTLSSVLNNQKGVIVKDVMRTKASGSKSARYLEAQPFVAQKLISLPKYGKHTNMCIEHCRKITANDTHRHDDIADTLYDAIKIGLIDKSVTGVSQSEERRTKVLTKMNKAFNKYQHLERLRHG